MSYVPSRGQMGAIDLLARMMAAVQDPAGLGVGADIKELEGGVGAVIFLPSGDRYRVTVQWEGDQEEEHDG